MMMMMMMMMRCVSLDRRCKDGSSVTSAFLPVGLLLCGDGVCVCVIDIMIRIQEVDLDSETIGAVHNMRISPSCTVAELKIAIACRLSVCHQSVDCVVERYYNTLKLLDVPSKSLHLEGFQKTNKVDSELIVHS